MSKKRKTISSLDEEIEELRIEKEEDIIKLRKELKEAKDKDVLHLYLRSFCREWQERTRPDALRGFKVYRDGGPSGHITKLLVGVPGPARTPFEGGIYPMLMVWGSITKPPKCSFPKGFFHPNVYPSGLVCVSCLNIEEGWDSEISIQEIFFTVQQLLAHTNMNSPTQSHAYEVMTESAETHNAIVKAQATEYAPGNFMDKAQAAFSLEKQTWSLVGQMSNAMARSWQYVKPGEDQEGMRAPRCWEEPCKTYNGDPCNCSCCEIGAEFWDKSHQMRHRFGTAG